MKRVVALLVVLSSLGLMLLGTSDEGHIDRPNDPRPVNALGHGWGDRGDL